MESETLLSKIFCNFTTSEALFEHGFDEPCYAVFYEWKKQQPYNYTKSGGIRNSHKNDKNSFKFTAPTVDAAKRFVFEKTGKALNTKNNKDGSFSPVISNDIIVESRFENSKSAIEFGIIQILNTNK